MTTRFAWTTVVVAAAATLMATAGYAKTFKWSSASDIPTLDIHSQNGLTLYRYDVFHEQKIPKHFRVQNSYICNYTKRRSLHSNRVILI